MKSYKLCGLIPNYGYIEILAVDLMGAINYWLANVPVEIDLYQLEVDYPVEFLTINH